MDRLTPLGLVVLLAAACGDNSGQLFELDDGSEVFVDGSGDFELRKDGRVLWEMSGARPIARQFEQTIGGGLGIWEFSRSNQTETQFGSFGGAKREGAGIVIDYGAAELRIEPGAVNQTQLALSTTVSASSLALPARCSPDATFYGWGAQYNATDQRGEAFDVWVSEQGIGRVGGPRIITGDAHTTYFPMPYFLDARGFGALVETTHRTRVDLCRRDPATAWFEVIDDAPLAVTIFHGPTPLEVIDQLGAHVGRPTAPPDWALGVWMGAQGGTGAILEISNEIRAAQIPATVLWVQDWTGVRINADGGSGVEYRWEPDLDHYPGLPAVVRTIKQRGFRFLAYANSFIDPELPNHFAQMAAADMLIKDPTGDDYVFTAPNGGSSLPDLTNPQTRDYIKNALGRMVANMGFDGWMSDFGEWLPTDAVLFDGTSALAYHNQFPIEWQTLWREVMETLPPERDFAIFARSGYTGVHAVAQIYWIGDQETSFAEGDGLPTVVPAMINLGLSGIPVTTHDIAGFSSIDGPSDKELYLRWTELGAFSPIMRTHDGNAKDENWSWNKDAETLAHFSRFARIHQALVPEISALAAEGSLTSAPVVRHLALHHPDDARARATSDQFLLGANLLVAPITERGAIEREVYLPAGMWFHIWTGESYEGEQSITIAAPIGSPPVFSRNLDRPDLRAIQ